MPLSNLDEGVAFQITSTLDTVLNLTSLVYSAIEKGYEGADKMDSRFRDKLNLAAMTVDNSLIEIATACLLASWTSKSAKIELHSNGSLQIESDVYDLTGTKLSTGTSATPALIQAIWVAQLAGGSIVGLSSIATDAGTSGAEVTKAADEEKNHIQEEL
jgi:hypothetical protein